jgi:hypothetical protein
METLCETRQRFLRLVWGTSGAGGRAAARGSAQQLVGLWRLWTRSEDWIGEAWIRSHEANGNSEI